MNITKKNGIKAKAEIITQCDVCNDDLAHSCCTDCGIKILEASGFRCFGYKEESWHTCEKCCVIEKNLKCLKCESHNIEYFGIDVDEKHTAIMYICCDCRKRWVSKPIKRRYIEE